MTTSSTKRVPPARPARTPKADLTPPLMKIGRPILTVIGVAMTLFSTFWIALNLGRERSIYAGAVMVAIGLALTVAAQMRRLYVWGEAAGTVDGGPVVAHADQAPAASTRNVNPRRSVPKQHGKRTPAAEPAPELEIPEAKPSWSLGPEFRFIVLYGRHLAAERPQWITDMGEFWDAIDWDSDETDSEYREVVEFLYGLARALPTWGESATREQMMAGKVARDNPFAFVAELESYHPMIAATAILMLVRRDSNVTAEDFDVVLEPWTDLGLSYRLGDMVFAWKGNGYQATEVESRKAPAPAPGVQRPAADPADGTAPPPPADFSTPPTPQRAPLPEPAPAPAEPVRHVEPERDDVPDPDSDLVVQAVELVISSQFGSTAMLQRKLRVGFALACKIMNRLHLYGVVGEAKTGGAARDVMVGTDELDDMLDFVREQEAERQHG